MNENNLRSSNPYTTENNNDFFTNESGFLPEIGQNTQQTIVPLVDSESDLSESSNVSFNEFDDIGSQNNQIGSSDNHVEVKINKNPV